MTEYGQDRNSRQTEPMVHIGVVVAAHAPLATGLVDAAAHIMGCEAAHVLAVNMDGASVEAVNRAVRAVAAPGGVLILADLFGGTAANVALAQLGEGHVEVVTGANLAMLLDAINHRSTAPDVRTLATHVARAGKGSVVVASDMLRPEAPGQRMVA